MNEPKRRGRPPKAKPELIALPVACPECGQAVGHYDDCPVGMGLGDADKVKAAMNVAVARLAADIEGDMLQRIKAQAYADRVWHGQSPDIKRAERIERVKRALAGQNLPFEGVTLP